MTLIPLKNKTYGKCDHCGHIKRIRRYNLSEKGLLTDVLVWLCLKCKRRREDEAEKAKHKQGEKQ